MDDDDDDIPLGMLRPGMRTSSAISLSSMMDGARTPGTRPGPPGTKSAGVRSPVRSPTRTPAMSPGLPATPARASAQIPKPNDTPESRKIPLRSRTTPLISADEIHPMFPSPDSSPKLNAARLPIEQEDVGYFGLNKSLKDESPAAAPAVVPAAGPPSETNTAVDDSPLFDFKSLDYPIEALDTSPQAVKDVNLAPVLEPPIVISPSSAKPSNLSIAVPSTHVTNGTVSGLKANDSGHGLSRQESMDTDANLMVRSMALYPDELDENEPPTPRVAVQQSHASLLDGSDGSTIRSPLSERLGNLVGPRPMSSKPSLPKLDTLRLEDTNGTKNGIANSNEGIRSPGSDTTISPTVSTIRDHQSVPSSFARATNIITNGQAQSGIEGIEDKGLESDESVSDPEGSVSDEDDIVPPKRAGGPPRSSFTNAPRPRVQSIQCPGRTAPEGP